MRRFWPFIVAPVLRDRAPVRVVEIGSQSGESTAQLLALVAELGAHLDVIDPVDMANLDQLREQLTAHGTFHKALSLDVLPTLAPADAYLVDGDHNWHTVLHELRHIHAATDGASDPGPVIILHDVDWPYGRRDLYYDPNTVPADARQPIMQGGLRPGRSEAVASDGFNAHLHHADHEGGPRNGVRTAVEDFVAEHPGRYRFESVPGVNGLGFLFRQAAEETAFAQRIIDFCRLPPAHVALVELLERERLAQGLAVEERRRRHVADVATLKAALATRDKNIEQLKAKLAELTDSRAYRAALKLKALRRALRAKL
jgi:hypothetical protein